MTVSVPSIPYPAPPLPSLQASDEHWRNVLLDSLVVLSRQHYDALQDEHPGARWRILNLAEQITDRRRQLAALGTGS